MGKSTVLCALIRMRKILRFRCVCVSSSARSREYLSFYNTCLLPVKVEFLETIPPVKTRNKLTAKLFHPILL